MEDHITKMFSLDNSEDFTDGTQAGEPLIAILCKCL